MVGVKPSPPAKMKRQRTEEERAARKQKKGQKKRDKGAAQMQHELVALAAQFGMGVEGASPSPAPAAGASAAAAAEERAPRGPLIATRALMPAVLGKFYERDDCWKLTECCYPGCGAVLQTRKEQSNCRGPASNVRLHTAPCKHAVTLLSFKLMASSEPYNLDGSGPAADGGGNMIGDDDLRTLCALVRCARGASIVGSQQWISSAMTVLASCLDEMWERALARAKTKADADAALARARAEADGAGAIGSSADTKASDGQLTVEVLRNVRALFMKASTAVETTIAGSNERALRLACHLDAMYFELYYAALCMHATAAPTSLPWSLHAHDMAYDSAMAARGALAPADYLRGILAVYEACGIDVQRLCDTHWQRSVPADEACSALLTEEWSVAIRSAPGDSNALLEIFRLRWREGIVLFTSVDHTGTCLLASSAERMGRAARDQAAALAAAAAAPAPTKRSKLHPHTAARQLAKGGAKAGRLMGTAVVATSAIALASDAGPPPPCHPLLQLWRDTCRDWCCHLYAYAVPTPAALDAIASCSPQGVVEVGAGTGYWSAALRAHGVDMVALDVAPQKVRGVPDDGSAHAFNEYHGEVPAFTEVERGGCEALESPVLRGRTLLLCYPPPGPMAADALRACSFGDDPTQVVAYVGEWCGDTADARFEHELQSAFRRVHRISLPNWGNTANSLTIWKRRCTPRGDAASAYTKALAPPLASKQGAGCSAPNPIELLALHKAASSGRLRTAFVKSKSGDTHTLRVRLDGEFIAEGQGKTRRAARLAGATRCIAALAQRADLGWKLDNNAVGAGVATSAAEAADGVVPDDLGALSCASCGRSSWESALRRCVYSRADLAVFCSAKCAAAGAPAHRAELAVRLCSMARDLPFGGDDFNAVHTYESSSSSGSDSGSDSG